MSSYLKTFDRSMSVVDMIVEVTTIGCRVDSTRWIGVMRIVRTARQGRWTTAAWRGWKWHIHKEMAELLQVSIKMGEVRERRWKKKKKLLQRPEVKRGVISKWSNQQRKYFLKSGCCKCKQRGEKWGNIKNID